jgi:hypothetical protein
LEEVNQTGEDRTPHDLVLRRARRMGLIAQLNGFVIGPVIAAMFMAAWDIFAASKSERR